jgi:hypothetical protein
MHFIFFLLGVSEKIKKMLSLWSVFAAACSDGTAGQLAYATALGTYNFESSLYGWNVGTQSEGCGLPITPKARTFSIWGYIGVHQTALLGTAIPGEEAYHLVQALEASGEWYRGFVGGEDRSNADALAAIRDMECHAHKAAHYACEVEPRTFACCAHTQYHTWLRVATLLSELIYEAYGDECGTPHLDDAEIERRFAQRFGDILRSLPDEGVRGVARRTARNVIAWAWKGVCDERGGVCPPVNVSAVDAAAVDALRVQNDLAWSTALVCAPEPPPS